MKKYLLCLKDQKFFKKALISKGNILVEIVYSSTVWKRIVLKIQISIINNDIEINLTEVVIDHTHRIGNPRKKRKNFRLIIAKFVRYYDRKEVFSKKKQLKGKGISITESLKSFSMKKIKEAGGKYGFKHV